MLQMLDHEECTTHHDRGPLFPGTTCFPLSPDRRHRHDQAFHTRGSTDQLNVIFDLLGTPSEADINILKREDARNHIRSVPFHRGRGIRSRLPWVPGGSLELLEQMLVFNASQRITVDQALAHAIFADYRNIERETTAKAHV